MIARDWREDEGNKELFDGYRVSLLQDKSSSGDRGGDDCATI